METETKAIGELLPAVTETSKTVSPRPAEISFSDLDLTVLENLPPRLGDGLMGQLVEIANCPLPAETGWDEDHFAQVMHSMSTALKMRSDDEIDGKLRYALYRRKLQGFSRKALSYLCEKALETCTFFPTISECLKILKGWENRTIATAARDKAKLAVSRERTARMEETMTALMRGDLDGEAIAALSEGIRSIALTRGLIWDDGDGVYRPRPDPDMAAIREGAQKRMGF